VLFHLLLLSIPSTRPLFLGLSLALACACKFTALSLIPFTACVLRFDRDRSCRFSYPPLRFFCP
jgi:hypothetical protein